MDAITISRANSSNAVLTLNYPKETRGTSGSRVVVCSCRHLGSIDEERFNVILTLSSHLYPLNLKTYSPLFAAINGPT